MQRIMLALAVVGALLLRPDTGREPGYPTRQIHLIVTFPPGGDADTVARPWRQSSRNSSASP